MIRTRIAFAGLAVAAAGLALAGCAALTRLGGRPIGPCGFDVETLQFAGDALAQARCLLRPVAQGGVVSTSPAVLPDPLASLVGQPVGDLGPRLQRYLAAHAIPDAAIGGPLAAPLSRARDGDAAAPAARYFVLHDTSTPWLGDAAAFPPDDDPSLNALARFAGPEAVAHVFVNRKGETLTGHGFDVPWRATQLEMRRIGPRAKGLFLHVELAQPRRRDPAGAPGNDAIAPTPGFTDAQYAQAALLYAAASARRGDWLIPATHAALDQGIAGAHDDPQHFELARLALALDRLRDALGR
ncbi:MAG TPA: hypothetical protein VIN75_20235 [Burkholderiaceae bacterium]